MYLHECYLIPAPTLNAVVEYLKERPYKEAAPLLEALNGHPNGSAEGLAKAGIKVHPDDFVAIRGFVKTFEEIPVGDTLPTPGETVVEFPARREH